MDKFLFTASLITLLHAAYSAAQHRAFLRLTERDFTTLPSDILIQTLVGLALACLGIVRILGAFREIRVVSGEDSGNTKVWDAFGSRSAFYNFYHRGSTLHRRQEEENTEDD